MQKREFSFVSLMAALLISGAACCTTGGKVDPVPGMGPCPTCRFDESLRKVVGSLAVSDDFGAEQFKVQWMRVEVKNAAGTTQVEDVFTSPQDVGHPISHAVQLTGTITRVRLEFKDSQGVVDTSIDLPLED